MNVKNNYELKDLEYQNYTPELDKFMCFKFKKIK